MDLRGRRVDLLQRHRAAYLVMSGAGLPYIARSTTDVVYMRTHGPGESPYAGSYSDADLRAVGRVTEWERGKAATGSSISTNDGHG